MQRHRNAHCGSRRQVRLLGGHHLTSHQAITSTGGGGDSSVLPQEWKHSVELGGTMAHGIDECRYAVRKAFRFAADLVSVIVSGGRVAEGLDNVVECVDFSMEELKTIVEEARYRPAMVAAHVVGEEAVRLAVQASVDTIEYAACGADPYLFETMAERGISLAPALSAFDRLVEQARATGRDADPATAERYFEVQLRMVQGALQAGVNIALGTDSGGAVGVGCAQRELESLCTAGLSNAEALCAGTRNAALACGAEEWLGTIEPDKVADLLVLARDPLGDIASLQPEGAIIGIIQAQA